MNTKELLKKVRKLEIRTKRLTNDIFSGQYHSSFKGKGMTFSEVRAYQYGDDVRNIDWKITAKLNTPYIKVLQEERELTLMLMVDISGSDNFGTKSQTKRQLATEISATIAFSAIQNNDKVGLLLFSDDIELFIPPQKGRTHFLRIIRELIEFEPKSKKTNIKNALEFIISIMKRKSIVFMISDFMDRDFGNIIKVVSKKHDFNCIRIFDRREAKLPNIGFINIMDPETNELMTINTSSKKNRIKYENYYKEQVEYFMKISKEIGTNPIHLETGEPYIVKLLSLFKSKR